MNEVNRGVLVLKPKEKFVAWVNASDEQAEALTLDEASQDSTAYLTPEIEDDNGLREFLEQNCDLLFEQELVGWVQDEDQWPATRNLSTFLEWFDVEFHSMVLDIAEGELVILEDA